MHVKQVVRSIDPLLKDHHRSTTVLSSEEAFLVAKHTSTYIASIAHEDDEHKK